MPPRAPPKFHQLTIRTHRLALLLSKVSPSTTIAELKNQVLSAARSTAFLSVPGADLPPLDRADAFELCRGVRDREAKARGVVVYNYEVLDGKATAKSLSHWDTLYIQFKDPSGELLPIQVTLPSVDDDEEERPQPAQRGRQEEGGSTSNKGKRRATSMD